MKTFCPLPWIHSSMNSFGNLRVCCIAYGSYLKKEDGTLYNAGVDPVPRNHEIYKKMRLMMLNSEKTNLCNTCYEREKFSIPSRRAGLLKTFPNLYEKALKMTLFDGTIYEDDFKISSYDLRLGNLCNSKCTHCEGATSSSMWVGHVDDWPKDLDSPYFRNLLDNTKSIKELYITGGEPLIIKYHWKILNTMIEKSNTDCDLIYNTNLSVLKKDMFSKWSKFRSVKLLFSIDGLKEKFEELRYPTKWNTIEQNLKFYEDNATENMTFIFAVTVSSLNILNIIDLFKWKISQGFKKMNTNCHFVILKGPMKYNIRTMSDEEKKKVVEKYEEFYIWLKKELPHNSEHSINLFSGIIKIMLEGDENATQ